MKNVESFYPLSPMQEGMLFHTLFDPGTGIYVEVLSVRFHGHLDIPVFEQAWQRSMERHPILRTSFIWEGVKEPVQVVHQKVNLPLSYQDWRSFSALEQNNRLNAFLHEERLRGIDLGKPPLMRLSLIQTGEDEFNFIWTHHHILLDGWSIPILLREVLMRYQALDQGIELNLPAVRPFRDYILWLKRQDLAKSESFWRQKLAGFTTPTPLPAARLREHALSGTPEFIGVEIQLSTTSTDALQNLARKHGLTLNTVIQGAWAILLSRYSGEEDVLFGTTMSGRPTDLPGSEQMLGLFINTLPVRVQVPGTTQVIPWFKELQIAHAEMRQFEYTPLVQIQSWSEVPRGTPLFESLMVFENLPMSGLGSEKTGNLVIEGGEGESHTNFPIALVAVPGERLNLKITYNNQIYEADTITRMMDHLQVVLEGILSDPQQTISSIPILTESERRQMLLEWNDVFTDYPARQSLAQLFEEQVRQRPEAIAVRFPKAEATLGNGDLQEVDDCLTYQQLNEHANQLAHYLQKNGVGPDVLVAIYMERSLMMIVATLGIIKAGGAYLPLGMSYPPERLAFMLEDSKVPVLLTSSAYLEKLAEVTSLTFSDNSSESASASAPFKIVCLDHHPDQEEIAAESTEDPVFITTGENMAYVMYTSGSTGKPKGVAIPQRGISRLLLNTNFIKIEPSDHVAHASNPSFDAATLEIWGAFLSGAQLVGVTPETALSAKAFKRYIREKQITVILTTTALFNHIAHEVPDAFVPLRYLVFGGEKAEATPINLVLRHGKPQHLINAYGPTESTTITTWYEVKGNSEQSTTVPIGLPISNTQIYVLDKNLQPVPIGAPGELYIGGDGLALGYNNRPELTEEKFIPNPFHKELSGYLASRYPGRTTPILSDERLYRTGDKVRYLPDGNIDFLGRFDFQVKLHGLRIELGEIEAALGQYPAIKESIVLMREDSPGDKRLVGYLVPKQQAENETEMGISSSINLGELRRFLRGILPDFMIPATFIFLEEIPIDPNGKIDRRALPAPEGTRPEIESVYEAPRTEREQILANIWAQVLKLDKVGVHDNFFELGGDSILSLQVISHVKKQGMDISYRQLFEHPTIGELASLTASEPTPSIDQGPVIGKVPLTPVQQWYFEHHESAPHHFNTSIMVEVRIKLDIDLVTKSLISILEHHDALRARFEKTDSGWQQSIVESIDEFPIIILDLSNVGPDEQTKRLRKEADAIQASLELSKPPLMRVVYFDLGQQRPHRLLFVFHHLVFDGVSTRIFVEDFLTAYVQNLSHNPVQLPPKTTSYQTWSEKLTSFAQSELIHGEIDYWARIGKIAYTHLPVDYPNGENTYDQGDHVTVSMSREETDILMHKIPGRYNVNLHAILLTALARTLAPLINSTNMLFELEGHGREEIGGTVLEGVDLSRTIGWFTSIYPFYLDFRDQDPLGQQIATVAAEVGRIPNRGLGFGVLKYLHDDPTVREQMAAVPAPEVNFNYLGQFDQSGVDLPEQPTSETHPSSDNSDGMPIRIIGEYAGLEQDPNSKRRPLLNVVCIISGGQLSIRWLYSQKVYKRLRIQHLAETYLNELRLIINETS